MEKIFKMMGFEDTENCARNAGCHVTAAEQQPTRVKNEHSENVQISDRKYEAMSLGGPV